MFVNESRDVCVNILNRKQGKILIFLAQWDNYFFTWQWYLSLISFAKQNWYYSFYFANITQILQRKNYVNKCCVLPADLILRCNFSRDSAKSYSGNICENLHSKQYYTCNYIIRIVQVPFNYYINVLLNWKRNY